MSSGHSHKVDTSLYIGEDEIISMLTLMEQDALLNTKPRYIKEDATSISLVSFQEMHRTYLKEHPKINPAHYLSNLRTMIKIRH